ncbi:hypothetical protein [Parashewanella tropica]|uniref:hypothetical protein n=1 Tax=Parashewanella tropica TaxID=2547970 RepID=UPI001059D7EC|nr:hypothetical protein [Parashewanella tropica]
MKQSKLFSIMFIGSMVSASAFSSSLPCISDIQGNGSQSSPYVIQNNTQYCNLQIPAGSTTYFVYQNPAEAMGVFELLYDDNGSHGAISGHIEQSGKWLSTPYNIIPSKNDGSVPNFEYYSISPMKSGKWIMTVSADKSGPLTHASFSAFVFYGQPDNPYQLNFAHKPHSTTQ